MDRSYLEFEKPIEEIHEQIEQTKEIGVKGQVDIKLTIKEINSKEAEKIISEFNKPNSDDVKPSKTQSTNKDQPKSKKISKK